MNFYQNVFAILAITFCLNSALPNDNEVDNKDNSDVRPNILFFLTDDWGFNDVGYYQNTDTATPFIDSLVNSESLRIDKHYVLPECTVTRCALLTGRHPMRYGMQDGIIQFQSAYALSRHETLLSNEFQTQGYKTYLVGKWHVGMRNWDYTPTYRGFDSFLGFYGGLINYYDHYGQNKVYKNTVDFHMNDEEYNEDGVYTLHTFTDRILGLLDESSVTPNEPFFMYVGWQGSHSPSEAPDEYAALYELENQHNDYRQYFQAQTTLTDDLFKEIVVKLKDTGLWDNTLVVFASDNGGSSDYGDNSPLRGGKFTLWEGGIRVPAFITGGYLPESRRGAVLDEFPLHVTDWYQTLLGAANLDVTSENELDGENMWPLILNTGTGGNDKVVEMEKDTETLVNDRYMLINVDSNDCDTEVCGALIYGGRWKILITSNQIAQNNMAQTSFWMRNFALTQDSDMLSCGDIPDDVSTDGDVSCSSSVCLFDLSSDPCEYYDVSEEYPEMSSKLYIKLKEYYDVQVPPLATLFDELEYDDIDPTDTGFWSPFDDSTWEEVDFEVYLSQYYTHSPITQHKFDKLKLNSREFDKKNKVINSVVSNTGKHGNYIITNDEWSALLALGLCSFVICTIYVFVSFRNPAMRYTIVADYYKNEGKRVIPNSDTTINPNYNSIA